jgi:hypothetical protein
MPPGTFMDESEVQSSHALGAHRSNIDKQREVAHHIRKAKRGSSGVAQSTGEESSGSGAAYYAPAAPPRGLKANDAAPYDSDENGKPQGKSAVEQRLAERGLTTVFTPKPLFTSSSHGGSVSGDSDQVSISRLVPMPDVGVGRSKLAFVMRVPDPSMTVKCKIRRTKVGVFTFGKDKKPEYVMPHQAILQLLFPLILQLLFPLIPLLQLLSPLIPLPRYSLYHETEAGDVFVLSARRRKKSKNSNYLLSLDQVDLSRKSPNFVGKVLRRSPNPPGAATPPACVYLSS